MGRVKPSCVAYDLWSLKVRAVAASMAAEVLNGTLRGRRYMRDDVADFRRSSLNAEWEAFPAAEGLATERRVSAFQE